MFFIGCFQLVMLYLCARNFITRFIHLIFLLSLALKIIGFFTVGATVCPVFASSLPLSKYLTAAGSAFSFALTLSRLKLSPRPLLSAILGLNCLF